MGGIKRLSLFIGQYIIAGTPGTPSGPLSQDVNGNLTIGIYNNSVTATSTITTTSATDSAVGSMTLTPPAGTYIVLFDTYVQSTAGGNSISVSLYTGGTKNGNTPRTIQFPTATLIDTGYPFYIGTQAQGVVVNGSQALVIEWNTNGGTASMFNRTLTVIRTA